MYYNLRMTARRPLSEQMRHAIKQSGKSRYAISHETGIAQSVLSRFVNGKTDLSTPSLEKICECIGARIVVELNVQGRDTKQKGK